MVDLSIVFCMFTKFTEGKSHEITIFPRENHHFPHGFPRPGPCHLDRRAIVCSSDQWWLSVPRDTPGKP